MVVKERDVARAKELVQTSAHPTIEVVTWARNLGSVVGPQEAKDAYARRKVKEWVEQIKLLASIAPDDPHQGSVFSVRSLS